MVKRKWIYADIYYVILENFNGGGDKYENL